MNRRSRACVALLALAVLSQLSATLRAADMSATLTAAAAYESGGDVQPLRQIETWVAEATGNPGLRRDLEAGLAKLLEGQATFEARRFACLQLAVVGGEACVPALAGLLKNEQTAGIACFALTKNPASAAGQALREALLPLRGAAKAAVIQALGHRIDVSSATLFIGLVRDPDPVVAEAAVIALGRVATPDALKTLDTLRRDSNAQTVAWAREASLLAAERLAATGQAREAAAICSALLDPSLPISIRRGAFHALLGLDADRGAGRILDLLRSTDAALQPTAIAAIVTLPPDASLRQFASTLPSLPIPEQVLLIDAFAARGGPDATAAVRDQLAARDPAVRTAALVAVGRLGDATDVPRIAGLLPAANTPEQLKAIELALAGLKGGDQVDQALIGQLRNRMAGPKTPVLGALVRRAPRSAFPIFLGEAASPDEATAKLAFRGMSRVAEARDVSAMIEALVKLRAAGARDAAQTAVGQTLARIGDPVAGSAALRNALSKTQDSAARSTLLSLLAQCPDPEALAAVRGALADPDPNVKSSALRTLAEWPDPSAWEPLSELYRNAGTEAERVLALRGLARLLGEENARPSPALLPHYRDLLGSARSDSDRKLVLGALAGFADPEALKLAVAQLENAGARAEAAAAVKRIAEAIKDKHPQAAQAALQRLTQ